MSEISQNKELELLFIQRVIKLLSDVPDNTDIKITEAPDFLINFDSRDIGLEIVRVYRKEKVNNVALQTKEGGWAKVVNEAKSIWDARKKPPIEVSVYFADNHIPKKESKQNAELLVQLIDKFLPEPDTHIDVRDYEIPDIIPSNVVGFNVYRYKEGNESYWHAPTFAWATELTPKQVQETINRKSTKYDDYLTNCDSVWLIIVAHTFETSSLFDIPQGAIDSKYEYPFDRVYLFDTSRDIVHQLKN